MPWLADRELLKLLQEEYLSLPIAHLIEVAIGAALDTAGTLFELNEVQLEESVDRGVLFQADLCRSGGLTCTAAVFNILAGAFLLSGPLRIIVVSKQGRCADCCLPPPATCLFGTVF